MYLKDLVNHLECSGKKIISYSFRRVGVARYSVTRHVKSTLSPSGAVSAKVLL